MASPDIYFVRHGLAGEASPGADDAQRPLTGLGRRRTRAVGLRLRALGLHFDTLLSSPLVRARQTAHLLQQAGLCECVEEAQVLAPGGDFDVWLRWLRQWRKDASHRRLGLVGHMPALASWAETLVFGRAMQRLVLKKAGVLGLTLPRPRLARRPQHPLPPFGAEVPFGMRTLLFLKGGIGDVVFSLPLLADLRAGWPGVEVWVLTHAQGKGVLDLCPDVFQTLSYGPLSSEPRLGTLLAALEGRRFDVALTPVRSPRAAWLLWKSHAPVRAGFRGGPEALLYTHRAPVRPFEVTFSRRFERLAGALGLDVLGRAAPLLIPPARRAPALQALRAAGWDGETPLVALHAGGGWPTKQWPVPHAAALAAALARRHGLRTLLVGGAADKARAEAIAQASGGAALVQVGLPSMRHWPSWTSARRPSVWIRGYPTLAWPSGVPTVSLFGPNDPGSIQLAPTQRMLVQQGLACRPCNRRGKVRCPLGHHRCMQDTTPATGTLGAGAPSRPGGSPPAGAELRARRCPGPGRPAPPPRRPAAARPPSPAGRRRCRRPLGRLHQQALHLPRRQARVGLQHLRHHRGDDGRSEAGAVHALVVLVDDRTVVQSRGDDLADEVGRPRLRPRPAAANTPRFWAMRALSSPSGAASRVASSAASRAVGVPGRMGAATKSARVMTSGFCRPSMVGPCEDR